MCKVEDLLYEAYDEGIRDAVLTECKRLREQNGSESRMEFADRLEIALKNVRNRKIKNK